MSIQYDLFIIIFVWNCLMHQKCEYTDSKKKHSYIHTIPQAKEIFQAIQNNFKTIYPFQMPSIVHNFINDFQVPYKDSDQKNCSVKKFKPPYEIVSAHFQKANLIYDKFNNNQDQELFNQNIFSLQKLKNIKNNDYLINVEKTKPYLKKDKGLLEFNSRFQSGNLSMASFCNDIYCLLLHNDINTSGYTSWFYFSVKCQIPGKYRFAIMNYGKAGWVYNRGVKICFHSQMGWNRGGINIFCQPNRNLYRKDKFVKFNTLYFEFQFQQANSEIYFSYNIPYTYNFLSCFLDGLQQACQTILQRKPAGISLIGNRLQLITVTNFQLSQKNNLPAVIIMARTHPGETVSSWILHQFLLFITSQQEQAKALRNNFVFKIFPMVNPDGVIHGNYRCSLSGRDLNRRWKQIQKQIFPQVYYIKNQILDISLKKQIKIIIDLHGHSQKKKVFAYGCNDRAQPHKCRLFPYIFSKLTSHFQFRLCNYFLSKYKAGTARIRLFHELKIPYIYTIQTSQFGTMQCHLHMRIFRQVGIALAKSLTVFFKVKYEHQNTNNLSLQFDKLQSQLRNDSALLKIGNEQDSGSDSEPSIDNIKFEKLIKMVNKKERIIDNKAKVHDRMKSETNNLDTPTKITIQCRPTTSYTKNMTKSVNKPVQNNQKKQSFRQTRLSSFRSSFEASRSEKIQKQKVGRTFSRLTQRNNLSIKAQKTETVTFINFSLGILDDEGNFNYMPSIHRSNNRGLNEELAFKLSFKPKRYNPNKIIN